MLNLLSNAVKFTPIGGEVSLEIFSDAKDGAATTMLHITVRDTGCGMTQEILGNLFVPFEQGHSLNAQQSGSTGLGLAIAHQLASLMGGDVRVESEPNKGSTFRVVLPFGIVPQEPLPVPAHWNDKLLLLFSHQEVVRQAIPAIAERLGLRSEVSGSRSEMPQLLAHMATEGESAHLTIVDGIPSPYKKVEFLRTLLEKYREQMGTVVLVVHDVDEVEKEAKAIGVDYVLPKPLCYTGLHAVLKAVDDKNPSLVEDVEDLGGISKGATGSEKSLRGKRVLLAEDNDLNTEIAVEILHGFGMHVDCAENGQIALNMLLSAGESRYDLVLTDIQMPVMNGYDLATAIRKSVFPAVATLPIVAISANAMSCDVQHSLAVGMNAHVSKPIDLHDLHEVLRQHIA